MDRPKEISSGVMDMKFMKKTKMRLEMAEQKKKEAALKKAYIDGDANEGSSTDRNPIEYTKDLTFLEDLAFGRMSFQGYNPEVEKLMIYYERRKNGEESEESEVESDKEIQDTEMAMTLRGGASALKKKFSKKRVTEQDVRNAAEKLNFDRSEIRKRNSDGTWVNGPAKFKKPNDS